MTEEPFYTWKPGKGLYVRCFKCREEAFLCKEKWFLGSKSLPEGWDGIFHLGKVIYVLCPKPECQEWLENYTSAQKELDQFLRKESADD